MALNFYTQGVDFSGLGQGIARGLEQAANMRMQQDQIVRKEIDDFKSTYDTGKMMAKDTPLFATEFENYRKTAIEYAKMNRGRVKAADLAAKKAELDAVRGKLNGVYENSAKAASVLDGLVKYADRMTAAGYALPDDMNRDIVMYKTQPIDKIDFTKTKSPADYQFEANETDLLQLDRTLAGIKDNKGEYTKSEAFPIPLGDPNKPGYQEISVPEREKFSMKDPYAVLGRINQALVADARIKNAATVQKNQLISSIQSDKTDTDSLIAKQMAMKTADKILAAYPELNGDITKASPAMVISATRGYLDRNTLGTYVSMKEFDAKLKNLNLNMKDKNTQERLAIARQTALGKNKQASASMLNFLVQTGGELYSEDELADMGFTKTEIKAAQDAMISFYQRRGYQPGTIMAPGQ
jgi:hypothetical protein